MSGILHMLRVPGSSTPVEDSQAEATGFAAPTPTHGTMRGQPSPLVILTPAQVRQIVAEEVRAALEPLRRAQDEEGVTVADAARRLGVSVRTIERRVRSGELPSRRIGGVRRVLLSKVLAVRDGE